MKLSLSHGKKAYFASDQHFGALDVVSSRRREQQFVRWLEQIKADAQILFLLGDVFDFWFEYREVVPKGFVRTLGKLAEMNDHGIRIIFFVGNHDLWLKEYLPEEIGAMIFYEKTDCLIDEKLFLIGHGDGLGPVDVRYKRLKRLFTNRWACFLFRWLHPDLGVRFGRYLSLKNKANRGYVNSPFLGEDKERLILYAKRKLKEKAYDFFIFGHRHLPSDIALSPQSRYINLGDWMQHFTYAEYDGRDIQLKKSR
ncbi:MAG: UDP-2,3-diacylglucosamine diphosphatase [Flavobacteriales bacterium AspAUS03]